MKTNTVGNTFPELAEAISEFGVESMDVAELFLRIQDTFAGLVYGKGDDAEVRFEMPTGDGLRLHWPSGLDWYMFNDPSLTEAHIEQVEAAFSFAVPTWAETNPAALGAVEECFSKIAAYYEHSGDFEKWEAFNRRILNVFKAGLGTNHRSVMNFLADMGVQYWAWGMLDQAGACFNEALAISEADPDLKQKESPGLIMNSAVIALAKGQIDMGRLLLDEVMERLAELPTRNDAVLLEALTNYAVIFEKTADLDEFDRVSLQAEEMAKEVWKSKPARVVSSALALIRSSEAVGRTDVAKRLSEWIVNKVESTPFSGDDVQSYGAIRRLFRRDCLENGVPASVEKICPNILTDMTGEDTD